MVRSTKTGSSQCLRCRTSTTYIRIIICTVLILMMLNTISTVLKISLPPLELSDAELAIPKTQTRIARGIVDQSFQETFAHLRHATRREGAESTSFKTLIRETANATLPSQPYPWWFQTMLRDANMPGVGLHGEWHFQRLKHPRVDVCTIEKVGSSPWRGVVHTLNKEEAGNGTTLRDEEKQEEPFRIAIFRDPLARFLSAYLDKCIETQSQHCKPEAIFRFANPKQGLPPLDNSQQERLLHTIRQNPKQHFEAYVDAMPLMWDVHFFPQSMYCDGIYRFWKGYDYVGNMSERATFHKSLDELVTKMGGRFETLVRERFNLPATINSEAETTTPATLIRHSNGSVIADGNLNVGGNHATGASSLVQQYYTPQSVRRVLQYLSIDYTLLDLDIPDWAEDMLAEV
mmetsp:Transcript_41946/g.48978  ORF Transcript_41946/g.48978 Transcript_41946/m.48978 type:complete len:403 (+) Transcript_41946:206-1414(+)